MTDLARLSAIAQAIGEPLAQSELLIDGLEQQGSAVRAAVLLVESGNHRLRNEGRKGNGLCGRIHHQEEALLVEKRA